MNSILQLYRGYANEKELVVFGHVFKSKFPKEYNFRKKDFENANSVIKMFTKATQPNVSVFLHWQNQKIETKTLQDGYFKFCIPTDCIKESGWLNYTVSVFNDGEEIFETGDFLKPYSGNFGFISDIDDTFLISHTRNIFRKLYILLFRNVYDRKVFADVVKHYQALSSAGRSNKSERNSFFYVSSSEWNLYRFITKFIELNDLPRAVLLLKNIKTSLTELFLSGRGSHNHKFEKIKHILEFYPNLKYTLLGDDSQYDPYLYEAICKIFPLTIKAVYIRQTARSKKVKTTEIMKNIESIGISVCYFKHSSEAIAHSKKIGLIE
jgi:phosphatidate phosphatase APP1